MFIDNNNLKNYNDEDIYTLLIPKLENVYENYKYVLKSDDELHKVALKEIEQSKSSYSGEENYLDYVVGRLTVKLDRYIALKLDDNESAVKIINRFISRMMKKDFNYKNSIESFKLLNSFCEKYNYYLDPDQVEALFNENIFFHDITALVVEKNIKTVKDGSFLARQDNIALSSAINTYCMLNKIEVKEPEVEIDDKELKADELYQYRKDLSQYPLLNAEEEKELALRIREGDQDAKEEFINRNLRLVISVAVKFINRGLPLSDLIQEGNIGLITAVDRYDPSKGFKFSTYGVHWIRRLIIAATRNKGREIKLPYAKYDEIGRYKSTETELTEKLKREPTLDEISEAMKISYKKALELHSIQMEPVSLNIKVGDEDITELGELIPSKKDALDLFNKRNLTSEVMSLLENTGLTQREMDVLIRRFGLCDEKPSTLEDIANVYKMSRERIRQIEKNALNKIRKSKDIKNFSIYMNNSNKAEKNIDAFIQEFYEEKNQKAKKALQRKDDEVKSVYEVFGKYPKKLVDKVLSELTPEEKELIKARFGSDRNNPERTRISREQQKEYISVLAPKIKSQLKLRSEAKKKVKELTKTEETKEIEKEQEVVSGELSPFMKEYLALSKEKQERQKTLSKRFGTDKKGMI